MEPPRKDRLPNISQYQENLYTLLCPFSIATTREKVGWPESRECQCTYLHNGIHGTCFLAEATVDALGHINVISGGPAAAVSPGLCLYGDGLGGAYGLAQLAGDAPLLPVGVAPQGVLPTEAWADGTLLKGVV